MTSAVFVEKGSVRWFQIDSRGHIVDRDLCSARPGQYVKRWIGSGPNIQTEQVCTKGASKGLTLSWAEGDIVEMAKSFCADISGRYFSDAGEAATWLQKQSVAAKEEVADQDAYWDAR